MLRLSKQVDAEKLSQSLKRALKRWQSSDYAVFAGIAGHLKAIHIESAGPEITASAAWDERQFDSLTRLVMDSIEEMGRGKGKADARRLLGPPDGGAKGPSDAGPDAASADK